MLNNFNYRRLFLKLEQGAVLDRPECSWKLAKADRLGILLHRLEEPECRVFVSHHQLFHEVYGGRAVIRH